jgi:hypothetical protein
MKTKSGLIIVIASLFFMFKSIAADDDFFAYYCSEAITVDGIGNENIWDTISWYPINNVWIPYNQSVLPTDFSGRFKLVWTEERLYILVEIIDDSLFDGHPSPQDNYWNDDCVEVFLDEDKSGGNHLNSFTAFAYHVSTVFDVVDNTTVSNTTGLFNDHVTAAYTRTDSLYTWELEIKVYPSSFTLSNPGLPVNLTANKKMGFSLAYCDTDGSLTRENFIGSKYLPQAQANDSYINASLFGTLTLVDTSAIDTTDHNTLISTSKISDIDAYPTIVKNSLTLVLTENSNSPAQISIINIFGIEQLLQNVEAMNGNNVSIDTSTLKPGFYYLITKHNNEQTATGFIKM